MTNSVFMIVIGALLNSANLAICFLKKEENSHRLTPPRKIWDENTGHPDC